MNWTRRRFLLTGASALGIVGSRSPQATASPIWVDERQIGPFVCRSTFPLRPYDSFFQELPRLEHELRRVLAVRPATDPIYLHLLSHRQQHESYVRERFPQAPYRRALFVKQGGRASVFAFLQRDLLIDLRHECTHALLHSDLAMVPLWLDEGIAEYFELGASERAALHPHLRAVRGTLGFLAPQSIRSLEEKRDLVQMSARDYRYSWAWVHFMLHGPTEAHRELVAFLADIRRLTPPGPLSDRLTTAVPHLEHRFVQHFKHWPPASTGIS